jgi:hypothetical protein
MLLLKENDRKKKKKTAVHLGHEHGTTEFTRDCLETEYPQRFRVVGEELCR